MILSPLLLKHNLRVSGSSPALWKFPFTQNLTEKTRGQYYFALETKLSFRNVCDHISESLVFYIQENGLYGCWRNILLTNLDNIYLDKIVRAKFPFSHISQKFLCIYQLFRACRKQEGVLRMAAWLLLPPLQLSEKFEWGDIMAILYTGEEQKQRYRSTICLMLLQPRGSMSGSNVNVFCKSPPSSLLWMRFSTACTGGGCSCISTVHCNEWTMNCSGLKLQNRNVECRALSLPSRKSNPGS